jgi:diamine N-acetyltransferase
VSTNETRARPDVTLAPLELSHAAEMYRWVSDPDVRRDIGLRTEPTLQRTQEWIVRARSDPAIIPSAICLVGKHVGNVVLDRIDRQLSTARLSIYIGEPAARGGGVGTAAVRLAVQRGFRELNKIWLTVHAENIAAIRCYQRLGFQLEGTLRDEFLLGDRRVAALYMGLLKRDFERTPAA